MARCLRRAGLCLKRGRDWVHSPDPDYAAKRATLAALLVTAAADPACRVVYLDEVSLYRQPTCAPAYAPRGPEQPRARRVPASDTVTRVLATLDHASGQVVARRSSHVDLAGLVAFYQQLVAAYPGERLYVVQDNGAVHRHPDVLVALEPQRFPNPLPLPRTWPTQPSAAAQRRWGELRLPVQAVWLPTYASWLNPIEKLWRKLRQEVTHLHPWADDLAELRRQIDAFLARFAHGSPELLRYVGLAIPN
jgi:transposase